MYPPSSKESDLERNLISALDEVPLDSMRRSVFYSIYRTFINLYFSFARCSLRFMDCYRRGLTPKQTIWANKKYHGHRTLPESIVRDLDAANVV
jgi:hypothetical protein